MERLSWQEEMKRSFRDPAALCEFLDLPQEVAVSARSAATDFPLFAPHPFVNRIRPSDPADPLLRQLLPVPKELETADGFVDDPVADLSAQTEPGVIRKYPGRALLITTGSCAIHCRYCFRRQFPYGETPHSTDQWRPALQRLATDRTLHEIILSGGDPLTLRDEQLQTLFDELEKLPALRCLRIHTRLPVMIPQRITPTLLGMLSSSRLNPIVVLHVNHAQEIDADVAAATDRLRSAGAWLMNQAVLLRGVNDSVGDLIELSETLVSLQIQPYYLHQLDRVTGTAHFEVPVERGRQLIDELRAVLPGYAVPRYVQERPGEPSKHGLA